MSKRVWTDDKLYLLRKYSTIYKDRRVILNKFNTYFSTTYTLRQLSLVANEYKIILPKASLQDYKRANPWLVREKIWTEEKLKWLEQSKSLYQDREDILNAFNKYFNTSVSLRTLGLVCNKFRIVLPKANRLLRKSLEASWISSRGFTEKAIGDDISWGNNLTFIKVSDSKITSQRYVLKNRYLYEQYHDIKLKSGDCVVHLDGDKTNYTKDNLYLITRSINAIMTKYSLYSKDSFNTLSRIKYSEWRVKLIKLNGGVKNGI